MHRYRKVRGGAGVILEILPSPAIILGQIKIGKNSGLTYLESYLVRHIAKRILLVHLKPNLQI